MAKLTRKEYTRKHLFMGAVILVAVILLVTGIAIWLLLGSMSRSAEGSLRVAGIVSTPMSFTDFYIGDEKIGDNPNGSQELKDVFVFDCRKTDKDGRITCDGKSWEKMSVTVRGKLNYADYLAGLYYELELPQGVIDAAKEGFLDISNFYDDKWNVKKVNVIVSDDGKLKDTLGKEILKQAGSDGIYYLNFEFTIKLNWGEKFGYDNPGRYYDEEGADIPDEEVMDTMNDFVRLINGEYNEKSKSFILTVTATPNNQ